MSILHVKELKQEARHAMAQASYPPKTLALIHAAVSVSVLLLGVLISYGVNALRANTGGLSGMGLRAILSTVDSVYGLASSVFLSFWELGIVYACLKIRRNEETGVSSLTQGLHRFGPLLRLYLLQALVYLCVIFFVIQLASVIFMLLPGYEDLVVMFETFATAEAIDEALLLAILQKALPLYAMIAVLSMLLIVPISYRYRMAMYLILDGTTDRATAAIAKSFSMMRKNCWGLFKVDLSFWWYYACGIGLLVISSGSELLMLMDITLPFGSALFYGLYLAGLLLLAWSAAAYVQTTYAAAYDTLLKQTEQPEAPLQLTDNTN